MFSLALLAGRLVAQFVLVCNELPVRKRKEVGMHKIALLPLFRKIQRYSKRHFHDGSGATYLQNGRKTMFTDVKALWQLSGYNLTQGSQENTVWR